MQAAQQHSTLASELGFFNSSLHHYRHPSNKSMLYTDGVKHFLQGAGRSAYSFIDTVASSIHRLQDSEKHIRIALLVINPKGGGMIIASGEESGVIYTQDVASSDTPIGQWIFYLKNNILSLATEL
jgi:hypothetical protein